MKLLGIRGRIILIVVSALTLSMLAAALMVRSLIYQSIIDDNMIVVDLLTTSVVHDIKFGSNQSDLPTVANTIISKYMTYYRTIKKLRFYDKNMTLLASSEKELIGVISSDPGVMEAVTSAKPTVLQIDYYDDPGIQSIAPILQGSRIIGAVVLDLSISNIDETLKTVNKSIAVILLITASLASMVIFVFLRGSIINRITNLMKVTRQISAGDYEVKLHDNDDDEIGTLARGLKTMISAIHDRDIKLRHAHDALEQRVTERTAELSEANKLLTRQVEITKTAETVLAQKANELERSNRELDQFAYVASHDLKAPLRAIANLAEWIEEDMDSSLSDNNRKQLHLLHGRARHMEALINAILAYSRVGRVADEIHHINTEIMLKDIIDTLPVPEGFIINIGEGMPSFITSGVRLSQVFSNLLNNAIKYGDKPDKGRIDIAVKELPEFFEFTVSDNGPGIDPQYHDKVFVIFQTLSPKDRTESTGIGLSLVKKIIEEYGGEIHLYSDSGKGATFQFTWPKCINNQQS